MSIFEQTVPEKTSGEGGNYEIPEPGNHVAVCVGLIDLGSREESFNGQPIGWRRKILIVWELCNERKGDGTPFYLAREFTLSFNEKSALRDWLQKWRSKVYGEKEKIDLKAVLGRACLLTVIHKPNRAGDKMFAKAESISALPKGMTATKPVIPPLAWQIGATPEERAKDKPPEDQWIPYLYGESVADHITRSPEWNGRPVPRDQPRPQQGQQGNGNGNNGGGIPEGDVPF